MTNPKRLIEVDLSIKRISASRKAGEVDSAWTYFDFA